VAEQDINQRIKVEYDGQGSKEAARDTQKLGDTTEQTGRRSERAAESSSRLGRAVGGLTGSLGRAKDALLAMVAGWGSFLAISGIIIGVFRDITGAVTQARDAMQQLGNTIRGLAANIGGRNADRVVRQVSDAAVEFGFDIAGRNQLLGTIGALTDINPDLNPTQLRTAVTQFGQLQRATGVTGEQAVSVTRALQSTVGLGQQQAIDVAAVLLNAGLGAQTIVDVAERSGSASASDFLALAFEARSEGDINRIGRSLPSLIGALSQREEDGRLSENLRAAGARDDQTPFQRFRTIFGNFEAGAIDRGLFERATGGAQQARVVEVLGRALPRVGRGRAALADAAVQAEIDRLVESEFVSFAERQNAQELRVRVAEERNRIAAGVGQAVGEAQTQVDELGGGSTSVGVLRSLDPRPAIRAFDLVPSLLLGGGGGEVEEGRAGSQPVVINNITNIAQQINGTVPAERAGLEGPIYGGSHADQ